MIARIWPMRFHGSMWTKWNGCWLYARYFQWRAGRRPSNGLLTVRTDAARKAICRDFEMARSGALNRAVWTRLIDRFRKMLCQELGDRVERNAKVSSELLELFVAER